MAMPRRRPGLLVVSLAMKSGAVLVHMWTPTLTPRPRRGSPAFGRRQPGVALRAFRVCFTLYGDRRERRDP